MPSSRSTRCVTHYLVVLTVRKEVAQGPGEGLQWHMSREDRANLPSRTGSGFVVFELGAERECELGYVAMSRGVGSKKTFLCQF